ncbi:hypothetical protein [Xylanimonas protaetiae]|uniref:Uncharacterized protein n=1 Tax=Xylanimonas protaetiae TaxID=2509457 RepID=A0A4P6F6X3_9MICO|nr:hypothetical protein [Xylanimonas protaetiae]QAY71186.1 hypothetical protein ET471_15035 [Xylanimonas protaetiae]
MRIAGQPSWRLSVSDSQSLEVALYVRDAAGIVVAGDDVPPPLTAPPPRSDVLDGADPAPVAAQWLAWWRTLVALDLELQKAPTLDGAAWQAWAREHAARRDAAGTPTDDFAGLAHAPALRQACVALAHDAYGAARRNPELDRAPWAQTKQVVDDVAQAHGVDPDVLSGVVIQVPTTGGWWRVVEPGAVLASTAAPYDAVVRAAFESAL